MSSALKLTGEAQEVALAEAQAVRAMASDDGYRERLAGLIGAATDSLGRVIRRFAR